MNIIGFVILASVLLVILASNKLALPNHATTSEKIRQLRIPLVLVLGISAIAWLYVYGRDGGLDPSNYAAFALFGIAPPATTLVFLYPTIIAPHFLLKLVSGVIVTVAALVWLLILSIAVFELRLH